MGLFDKLESSLQSVKNAAMTMPQNVEELAQKPEENGEKARYEGAETYSRYESLRPMLRTVLTKDNVSDKDLELLKRKAAALGMDADEFELLFDGMLSEREKYANKVLFSKYATYERFFGDDKPWHEDGDTPFDKCFEATFYSDKEKHAMKTRRAKEEADELKNLSGMFKMLNPLG